MDALNDLMKITEDTQHIIDSLNALSSPVSTEEEFEHINKLVAEREASLHTFFKQYTTETLEEFTPQLTKLVNQDQEIVKLAESIKKEMTQKIIQQKKNLKAKKIYQGM